MKKAGVEEVNEEAAQLLAEALEEIALDLSKEAELLAKHAGRKTVEVADIKLALRL
jgi:histone H3/H4